MHGTDFDDATVTGVDQDTIMTNLRPDTGLSTSSSRGSDAVRSEQAVTDLIAKMRIP